MSIASRIEAIEEHLTDDYSVLTLAGADLTNVDKNILNLKPTWKERLLYFMNNGTQQVWDNWEKVNGTGTTLTLNNTVEAPMSLVYKGNTLQNGTPTPETPQDIHVVSGDNSIVVGNDKNIFNMKEYASANSSYFTYSSSTGLTAIAKDNRATASVGYPISITASTKYYIKTDTDKRLLISQYNSSDVWITNNEVFNGGDFTTNANASHIRIKVADTLTSFPTIVGNVYISTSNDYQSNTYSIDLGVENFINAPDITLTGTGYVFNLSNLTIPSGTYTLDIKCPYTSLNMACIDKDETEYFNGNKNLPVTIEATNGIKTLRVYNGNSAGGTFKDIQLTEGSTPQRVSTNPIQLLHIPNTNYQDRIFHAVNGDTYYDSLDSTTKDSLTYGEWYLKKEIGKVVLNGSETGWAYSSTNTNFNIRPYGLGMRSNNMFTGYIPKICSHFKYFASNGNQPNLADGVYENIAASNISFLLFHCDSLNITTLESWQTWLSTNKPIIYYLLETPTYTLIEDSTLISQLEAIKSKTGQTNITQENNDLPFELDVIALSQE